MSGLPKLSYPESTPEYYHYSLKRVFNLPPGFNFSNILEKEYEQAINANVYLLKTRFGLEP